MNQRNRSSRRRQEGVTLIVALVVLVIIGLTSAAVMRGSLSTDLVANNARTQTLAMQAAQIGLRYCEDQTFLAAPEVHVLAAAVDDDHAAWRTYDNWSTVGTVSPVPDSYFESEHGTFKPATLPQCIVQRLTIGGKPAFQITSRGFSPDYEADDDGFTKSGSVVWLQSIIHL